MRLLIDAHCFDYKTTEGINTYIKGLYSALILLESDIEFYFAAADTENVKSIFGERSNVHYIRLSSSGGMKRLFVEFPKMIDSYKIDVAHFQYTAPIVKRCKTIVTLHDILFVDYPEYFPASYRMLRGPLFYLSAKRADLLLTVSDYSRQQISKHYKIDLDRIVVTPNAVSDEFYQLDLAKSSEFVKSQGVERYILYVSRFEPRKNHLALVKAYAELELWQRGIDLVFIGKTAIPTAELDSYLSTLPDVVRNRIHIINQVGFDELLYWYKSASLFVYPSLAEGFGIPPVEAAAMGVPCVCSDKTSMGDFRFFGDDLIDIDSSEVLKNRIMYHVNHSVDIENTSRIVEDIKLKYNWSSIAKSLLTQINDLK